MAKKQGFEKITTSVVQDPVTKPRRNNRWLWIGSGIFVVFLLCVGGALALLVEDSAASAEAADRILRPLIGDRATIAVEGFILGIQDKINHYRYKQPVNADYQPDLAVVPLSSPSPTPPTSPPASALPTPIPNPQPLPITLGYDATSPLPGEGEWNSIPGTDLDTTFIRTDASRPYAVVNLVYIPMNELGIAAVAGTQHPGGELGKPGPGKVPDTIQQANTLVAAFNGGFQEKDGHYGMLVDGTSYVPLQKGLGSIFIYRDGHVSLGTYDGSPLSPDILAVRQNGPLLVSNYQDTTQSAQGLDIWYGTAAGDYITWRSGLGITAQGDLVYAVGPSLTPVALADALRLAGSVNAMQLDINTFWVRFVVYQPKGNGQYSFTPLVKGLANGGQAYLTGYEKDFFYLYKKE